MAYVAYGDRADVKAGEVLKEEDFDAETWAYMLDHGIVVLQGSPDDPNVLAALAAGEAYEDPRDVRIAELEARLAALGAPVEDEGPVETEEPVETEDPAPPVESAPASDAPPAS